MPYPIDAAGRVPLSQLALSSPGTVLSSASVVVNQFGDGGPAPPPDPPNVNITMIANGQLIAGLSNSIMLDAGRIASLRMIDTLKYLNGAAPANGTPVDLLFGVRGTTVGAVQQATRNLPTFDTAEGALRFDSANAQIMGVPGALPSTVSNDLACTMVAVIKPAATPVSEQTIGGCSRDGAVQYYRECARLTMTGSAFRFRAQSNAGTDAEFYASVAYTPVNTETYILIGRHANGGPGGLNRLSVRAGGATLTGVGPASVRLAYTAGASMDRFVLGGIGMFGSYAQSVNGWMYEYDFINRYLSDTEVTDWIAALQAMYKVP